MLPFDPARALPPGTIWTESDGKRYAMLPSYFVTALEMPAADHMRMVAAVQPFVDTAISKTVNVPADYPFADFKDLYFEAWKSGLKGLTTYRPNAVLGSVLDAPPLRVAPQDFDVSDPDRRIRLEKAPQPPLASLRWPGRPELVNGNPAWTYMVRHPLGDFALFIGHIDNGPHLPVRGVGQRRRAAARPGRDRQDPVDGHARRRSAVAAPEARRAGEGERRRRLRHGDAPLGRKGARAELGLRFRPAHPLPLQRARRLQPRRQRARRRWSTRCSVSRSPRRDRTARCPGRWTSSTTTPATTSSCSSRSSSCPMASGAPIRCGSRANIRARSTACARRSASTCACAIRPGSA